MSSNSESHDRQRWAELKGLFEAALDVPEQEWPALMMRVRERDPGLADDLQRLLDGHLDTGNQVRTLKLDFLAPGAAVGPYVLTELLGEGGMGQVFRARDERLGREVAIKVLPPELAHDPDRRARMEREARAMGMLSHPNIVTVYDIGDYKGSPFIVSEVLEGQTLRQQILAATGAGNRLAATEVVQIVAFVADALGAAHRRGIVHRDIKPENIFVTSDGRIKVLDFGIAKRLDAEPTGEATLAGALIGTLQYMAPEQLRGETARPETDVYGCGVLLFEMLAGVRPYAGSTQAALIGAILHQPPPKLAGVAPALAELVARCLQKDPAARPSSGLELAAALGALGDLTSNAGDVDLPAPAVPRASPDAIEHTAHTLVSRRRLVAASVVVFCASIAIGGALWLQPSVEDSPPPSSSTARRDITLPAPARSDDDPEVKSVPPAPSGNERRKTTPSVTPSRSEPSVPPSAPTEPAAPPPASPPIVAPPELTGVWTVTEQLSEDVHAIECSASGALQLTINDGLVDGTMKMKRDCKDLKQSTTDSTDVVAALATGVNKGDAVSFVTRVVDEGVVTRCRYSGQVVGSARGTIVGEVTCEARAAGLSSLLTLRGSWRATRLD